MDMLINFMEQKECKKKLKPHVFLIPQKKNKKTIKNGGKKWISSFAFVRQEGITCFQN